MKKKNAGFTLVETIVVIAILGVLMAVLVPQYIQYVEKSRAGICSANREIIFREMKVGVSTGHYSNIDTAYEKMFVENGGRSQELLVACPSKGTVSWNARAQVFACDKHGGDVEGGETGGEDGGEETPSDPTPKPGSHIDYAQNLKNYFNDKISGKYPKGEYIDKESMEISNNGDQKAGVFDKNGNKLANSDLNLKPNDFFKDNKEIDGKEISKLTAHFTPNENKDGLYSTDIQWFEYSIKGNPKETIYVNASTGETFKTKEELDNSLK